MILGVGELARVVEFVERLTSSAVLKSGIVGPESGRRRERPRIIQEMTKPMTTTKTMMVISVPMAPFPFAERARPGRHAHGAREPARRIRQTPPAPAYSVSRAAHTRAAESPSRRICWTLGNSPSFRSSSTAVTARHVSSAAPATSSSSSNTP